jgi:hypothetical protein
VLHISDFSIRLHRFKRIINGRGEFEDIFTSASERLDATVLQVRATHRGLEASMEQSLPTLLYGHNVRPATIDEATALVTDLHRRASRFVEFKEGPSGLRVPFGPRPRFRRGDPPPPPVDVAEPSERPPH